jgi:hypothetical protein
LGYPDPKLRAWQIHRLHAAEVFVRPDDLIHSTVSVGDVGAKIVGKQRPHARHVMAPNAPIS